MAQKSIDEFLGSPSAESSGKTPAGAQSVDAFLGAPTPDEATAQQATAPQSRIGHLAKLAGQGLAQGVIGSIVGMSQLGDSAAALAKRYLPGQGLSTSPESQEFANAANAQRPLVDIYGTGSTATPTSADVDKFEHNVGLAGEQPEGAAEGYLAAGARGLGATPAALLMGGANAPALALGSTLAGSVAGEAAQQAGAPAWMQTLAGIVPGLALGGWAGARAASREADAARQAVDEATAGLANAKHSLEEVGAGVDSNPIVQVQQRQANAQHAADVALAQFGLKNDAARDASLNAIENEAARRLEQADNAREGVAATQGASTTLQEAGLRLQAHARDWLGRQLPLQLGDLWSKVDANIPENVPTPLEGFRYALGNLGSDAGNLEPLAAYLKPRIPAQLRSTFDSVFETPAGNPAKPAQMGPSSLLGPDGRPLQKVVAPAQPAQPIVWADAKALRSTLGEAMSDPKTINEVGRQNLSALYAGLTVDLKSTAEKQGVLDEFNDANEGSKRLFDLAEGPVAKLVASKDATLASDPEPGKAAASLLSGGRTGDTQLAALREAGFPIGELGAAALRDDPQKLPALWNGLSQEGKAALLPQQADHATLDSALSLRKQAPQEAALAREVVEASHQAALADAQIQAARRPNVLGARADAMLQQAKEAKIDAERRLEAAKAAVPKQSSDASLIELLQNTRDSGVGAAAGIGVEALLNHGLPPEMLSQGAILGYGATAALSPLYSGVKGALSRPNGLVGPGAGALGAGVNSLGAGPSAP